MMIGLLVPRLLLFTSQVGSFVSNLMAASSEAQRSDKFKTKMAVGGCWGNQLLSCDPTSEKPLFSQSPPSSYPSPHPVHHLPQGVEDFIALNSLSSQLHTKIFRYYSDVWLRFQEEASLWSNIDELSPSLRAAILADMVSALSTIPRVHTILADIVSALPLIEALRCIFWCSR